MRTRRDRWYLQVVLNDGYTFKRLGRYAYYWGWVSRRWRARIYKLNDICASRLSFLVKGLVTYVLFIKLVVLRARRDQ